MSLRLVNITPKNWRQFTKLQVAEAQQKFVANNVLMLARAYVYRDEGGQAWGICQDSQQVGLLVQRDYSAEGKQCCILDQMMIAEPFQKQGYGLAIMRLWIEQIRLQNSYDLISLCYVAEDAAALNLYQRLGFVHNGKDWENEIGMELMLR